MSLNSILNSNFNWLHRVSWRDVQWVPYCWALRIFTFSPNICTFLSQFLLPAYIIIAKKILIQKLSVTSNFSEMSYSDLENMYGNLSYIVWHCMTNQSLHRSSWQRGKERGQGKEVNPESEQSICSIHLVKKPSMSTLTGMCSLSTLG